MKFEKYLNSFKEYLESNKFSERTVETYCSYARQFLSFVEEYYSRITSLEKITKDIVLDYQNYLANYKNEKGEPLANKTQSLKLRALKKFFFFLIKRDLILKDPTPILSFPKEEERLARNILSEKEVFVKAFIKHLLAYGLGRELTLADRIAVEEIAKESKKDDYKMREVIKNIVVHPIFTQHSHTGSKT